MVRSVNALLPPFASVVMLPRANSTVVGNQPTTPKSIFAPPTVLAAAVLSVTPNVLLYVGPTPCAETEADSVDAALVPSVLPFSRLNVAVVVFATRVVALYV